MRWVCEICGYVHDDDEPPGGCPVCGAPRRKFAEYYGDEDSYAEKEFREENRDSFDSDLFADYEDQ